MTKPGCCSVLGPARREYPARGSTLTHCRRLLTLSKNAGVAIHSNPAIIALAFRAGSSRQNRLCQQEKARMARLFLRFRRYDRVRCVFSFRKGFFHDPGHCRSCRTAPLHAALEAVQRRNDRTNASRAAATGSLGAPGATRNTIGSLKSSSSKCALWRDLSTSPINTYRICCEKRNESKSICSSVNSSVAWHMSVAAGRRRCQRGPKARPPHQLPTTHRSAHA